MYYRIQIIIFHQKIKPMFPKAFFSESLSPYADKVGRFHAEGLRRNLQHL
jgi:hypothetical protein